ncbi:MAG TPA: hypothetical protein PKL09_01270 [bacterium]|nr:hypothetical protein [bacterium]HNS33814.1 hypothetical protein [bacterium]HNZ73357.1 hypothetical protein [bacterium]HOH66985.1 hypothetical protein [bacterium]HQA63646.1 hypothetical protein [bacterium]
MEEVNKKSAGILKGAILGGGVALVIVALIAVGVFFFLNKQGEPTPAGSTEGQVDNPQAALRITVITKKDCPDCWDVNLFLNALRQNNIKEEGLETVYVDDAATQSLIDKYKITKVPTVLIAGELDKNPTLASAWPVLGEVIDGVFVFRDILPPYIDLTTGEVRGKFSLTYLVDQSCQECYNYQDHLLALNNLGMNPIDSQTIDVASDEGKQLVEKYDITLAPTIILTGDLSVYNYLSQVWSSVGQVTEDGTYIFTKLEEMGTHKDLATGEIVKVEIPVESAAAPVVTQ